MILLTGMHFPCNVETFNYITVVDKLQIKQFHPVSWKGNYDFGKILGEISIMPFVTENTNLLKILNSFKGSGSMLSILKVNVNTL